MYVIREVMHCRPGKVRPLVEKFLALAKLTERVGMGRMRVMTDVSSEQYWTLVAEMETESLDAFVTMQPMRAAEADMKEFERIMAGYHDLVDHGRREIYKLEG